MRRTKVRIIERSGEAVLVEWMDGELYRRGIVPVGAVEGSQVKKSTLDMAIPYGANWEQLVTLTMTPAALANELRRHGIWMEEDLLERQQDAFAAFLMICRADWAELIRTVKRSVK